MPNLACPPRSYPVAALLLVWLGQGGVSCEGGGGGLAVSAGAPVMTAVRGTVTRCGVPVSGAEVILRVQQDHRDQARPVDARIGPVTTAHDGSYVMEVDPAFAVPGSATAQLHVSASGVSREITGVTLEFALGRPPRDTLRLDAELFPEPGSC